MVLFDRVSKTSSGIHAMKAMIGMTVAAVALVVTAALPGALWADEPQASAGTSGDGAASAQTEATSEAVRFEYGGFIYEVTKDSEEEREFEASLVGIQEGATSCIVTSSAYRQLDDGWWRNYTVTDIDENVLKDYAGQVLLECLPSDVDGKVYKALENAGAQTKLLLYVPRRTTTTINDDLSFAVEGVAEQLPSNTPITGLVVDGSQEVNNASDKPFPVYLMGDEDTLYEVPDGIAANETIDMENLDPFSAFENLKYSTDNGNSWSSENVELSTRDAYITVPSGAVDHNGSIMLSMNDSPGFEKGYLKTTWSNNQTSLDLENGYGTIECTVESAIETSWTQTFTIHVKVEAAENAVWIDGLYHDENFVSDDGSIKLEYGQTGTPTITLNGAHISHVGGGPDSWGDGDWGEAGIYAQGDLNLQLEGEPSSIDVSTEYGYAIRCGGHLNVSSDSGASLSASLSKAFEQNFITSIVDANSVELNGASLDLRYVLGNTVNVNGVGYGLAAEGESLTEGQSALKVSDSTLSVSIDNPNQLDLAGMALYAISADWDTGVTLSHAEVTVEGDWRAAFTVSGDVSISNDSVVSVNEIADNRWPAAIRAGGILDISDSYVEVATGSWDADYPAAILAEQINLDGAVIADPDKAVIGETEDPWASEGGTAQTVLLDGKASPTVRIAPVVREGETLEEAFPNSAVQEAVWEVWREYGLGMTGSVNPDFVLNSDAVNVLLSINRLIVKTDNADLTSSGIEKLPALTRLQVRLTGAEANTQVKLSEDLSRNLSELDVYIDNKVETLSVDAPLFAGSIHFDPKGVDGIFQSNDTLRSLTFEEGCLASQVSARWFDSITALDLSPLTQLETLQLDWMDNLSDLTIQNNDKLIDLQIWNGLLDSLVLPNNAFTNIDVTGNQFDEFTVPDAAMHGSLIELDVQDNHLQSLTVPDSVKELGIQGNQIAFLDLEGMVLSQFRPGDYNFPAGMQSGAKLNAQTQSDGSIVVDLSAWKDRLLEVKTAQGSYDETTGKLVYQNIEAAQTDLDNETLTYRLDTLGVVQENGSETAVVLDVQVSSLEVSPYVPEPSDPEGGNGGTIVIESTKGDGDQLVKTSDALPQATLVAVGIIALLAAAGVVLSGVHLARKR